MEVELMRPLKGLTIGGFALFNLLKDASKRESRDYLRGYLDSAYRFYEYRNPMDRDIILRWVMRK